MALSGRCQTGFAFFGNDEEGRSRIEFQVTLKLTPKIGHNSKVDQRKRQNSQPITRNLPWRFPSLKKFHQRTQARAIKKSKDGVIALVIADRKMVHIVSQAHDEVVANRYRRDFVERNLIFNKQIPKNCNVNFDRWDAGELNRLTVRKKVTHFAEKIIANANEELAPHSDFAGEGESHFCLNWIVSVFD